ncbi:MAG: RICIN domain-containing protein [Acidobacteria bacterium]|nr:RICIN domain-containing protein [Acidobacteriota bacterium]
MGTIIQTASAQFRDQVGQGSQATDIQRELVRRELENQVSTQRGGNVTVRIDRAWSNNLSNRETNIRGTALISVRRGREEAIDFDAVIDTRSNRVTRVDWRPAGQGNQGDYNRPDYNRPSSGQFQSGRYEIQLVATNRMLAVGANRTVVQTDSRNNRNQGWVLEDAGNGFYYIKSADTGEVMTVSGGGSGSTIVLARQRRGSDDQLWEIRSGPDNDYYLPADAALAEWIHRAERVTTEAGCRYTIATAKPIRGSGSIRLPVGEMTTTTAVAREIRLTTAGQVTMTSGPDMAAVAA